MVAFALALLASVFPQNTPHDGRVEKPQARVDFSFHSDVVKTLDGKFVLTNRITNNAKDPLSVEWQEGGIICTGALQLNPGQSDTGEKTGSIIEDPSSVNSVIKYGVTLGYSSPAQVYIDPQPKTASLKLSDTSRETTYERRNADNSLVFSIKVIANLNKDKNVSDLLITVTGKLSVALAIDTQVKNKLSLGMGEPTSYRSLRFRDETVDKTIYDWLRPDSGELGPEWFRLDNEGEDITDNRGRVFGLGERLKLKRINVLAFFPNQKGFVGFPADVYLPKNVIAK